MLSIILPSAKEKNIVKMLVETEKEFPEAEIIVSTDRDRRGKGWAIRQAFKQAKGDIICFIDGDLDIHPKMIKRLLHHLDEFDIVVGTKNTRVMISRWILTILSRIYISMFFGIPVDTQTGVKIFKRDALTNWKDNSFAFDIEILAKALKKGSKMFEVTVDVKRSRKMDFSSVVKCFLGSLKILKNIS